jgi:DNA-binding cell septation regulator SpoVG
VSNQTLQCLRLRHHAKGKLIGYADFKLPTMGLIFRNCAVLDGENGLWVQLPTYRHAEGDSAKWVPCVDFADGKRRQQWEREAAMAVEQYIRLHENRGQRHE